LTQFSSRLTSSVSPFHKSPLSKNSDVHLLESPEAGQPPPTPDSVEHIQPKIKLTPQLKVDLESPIKTFKHSSMYWLLASGASFIVGSLAKEQSWIATLAGLGFAEFGLWQGLRKGRQVEGENEAFVQKAIDQQQATLDANREKAIRSTQKSAG
jgi:hypothetical protein